MLADYETAGLTVGSHPIALLRERLPAGTVASGRLEQLSTGAGSRIGGLVVARQRPGTAGGVVFILLEDEYGMINLIVPPKVYERHRLMVRTEPLMLVEGKLERFAAAGGAINVLVDKVGPISAPDRVLAQIKDFSMLDDQVRRGLAEQRAAAAAGTGGGSSAGSGAGSSGGSGSPARTAGRHRVQRRTRTRRERRRGFPGRCTTVMSSPRAVADGALHQRAPP